MCETRCVKAHCQQKSRFPDIPLELTIVQYWKRNQKTMEKVKHISRISPRNSTHFRKNNPESTLYGNSCSWNWLVTIVANCSIQDMVLDRWIKKQLVIEWSAYKNSKRLCAFANNEKSKPTAYFPQHATISFLHTENYNLPLKQRLSFVPPPPLLALCV